ncbi:MAG: GSCFA domain-containing protein [Bacteroidota bacterium]
MDQFRTELHSTPAEYKISHHDPMLTLGSCFADSIGQKLKAAKFSVSANPFGTLYNPLSIHKHVLQSIYNQTPQEHTYLQHQGIVLNFDFHSEFSSTSKNQLETKIKEAISQAHHFLKSSKFVFLTYGTAWAYERLDTKEVVANCHKMPSRQFHKFLLTQKKILESFDEFYRALKIFNPEIRIILTVSPVRHLKDTLELNSVGKSILRLTSHTLNELYSDVDYFPAYEILLDDLRDYRFYSSDMIHPTSDAIDYIWKKFSDRYFDSKTTTVLEKWQAISKAIDHKAFHPLSSAHQNFLKETLTKLQDLRTTVNVEEEILNIQSQLTPIVE